MKALIPPQRNHVCGSCFLSITVAFWVAGCNKRQDSVEQKSLTMGLSESDVSERVGAPLFLIPTAIEQNTAERVGDPETDAYFISRRFFYKLGDRDRVMYFGFNRSKSLVMIDVRDELSGKFTEEEIKRIGEMEMERYQRQE